MPTRYETFKEVDKWGYSPILTEHPILGLVECWLAHRYPYVVVSVERGVRKRDNAEFRSDSLFIKVAVTEEFPKGNFLPVEGIKEQIKSFIGAGDTFPTQEKGKRVQIANHTGFLEGPHIQAEWLSLVAARLEFDCAATLMPPNQQGYSAGAEDAHLKNQAALFLGRVLNAEYDWVYDWVSE